MARTLNDAGLFPDKQGRVAVNDKTKSSMKKLLDQTGPGFCLAKWTQVTMHLGNGLTHSCHHPSPHKIPLEELKNNPSALHNTGFKKQQRTKMLNGERPKECDYCWRVEDNGTKTTYSDRVYKSIDSFSIDDHDDISKLKGHEDVYPRYVEVSFSNVCNFKCAYCGPNFSTKWVEEIKQHGPYKLEKMLFNGGQDVQTHFKNSEDNPYTDAFWKWFPKAKDNMHTFRITGGEPLMSKHTFKVIDYLLENPNPDLEFAVNSNAGVPDKLWLRFVDKVNQLVSNKCIKKFILFTSAEATGEQCNYIRDGMDWNKFTHNVKYFLDNTKDTRVTFMSAFNLLSAPTFKTFLEYVFALKQEYNSCNIQYWIKDETLIDLGKFETVTNPQSERPTKKSFERVGIDTPYVRHPEFLDARNLTKDIVEDYLVPALDYMIAHAVFPGWNDNIAFTANEIDKFKRIVFDLMIHVRYNDSPERKRDRKRFYQWVIENSRRRNKDFVSVFPELKGFVEFCKKENGYG
jgi:organic radical activating enzyme